MLRFEEKTKGKGIFQATRQFSPRHICSTIKMERQAFVVSMFFNVLSFIYPLFVHNCRIKKVLLYRLWITNHTIESSVKR